jgi:hypothetical protein
MINQHFKKINQTTIRTSKTFVRQIRILKKEKERIIVQLHCSQEEVCLY